MPCLSALCYSVSFHPQIKEWNDYKETFLNNFKLFCKKYKYIISTEKGSQNYYTHYQGFIELNKEKRSDAFKKSAFNKLLKNIELSYPNTALKLTSIIRDVSGC